MKHTNKIGLLAAIGISMSVACIIVSGEVASATGSMHNSHYGYNWSGHHHADHWYDASEQYGDNEHHYGHSHALNDECTCQDTVHSGDDVTDENTQSQNEDGSVADSDSSHSDISCDENSAPGDQAGGQDGDIDSDTDGNNDGDDAGTHTDGDPGADPGQGNDTDNGSDSENDNNNNNEDNQNNGEVPRDDTGADEDPTTTPTTLELAVDQQVGVGGGEFKPADTSDAAVAAQVGNEVVWQVTVAPVSVPVGESRMVKIAWVAPVSVEVMGHDASSGTYDGAVWTVDIAQLPAELTVRTKLKDPGSAQALATITKISCVADGAEAFCDFQDTIVENNSNPSVITTDTAPATNGSTAGSVDNAGATLGASTDGRGGEGVLGASTNTSRRGVGGRRVTYLAGSNGVLGVATGSLADTGMSAVVYVMFGLLLVALPLTAKVAVTKK